MSKGYSRDSLPDSNNLFYLYSCNQVFMSILANKNGQNIVYRQYQVDCTLFNHDARPKIIDTPLTLIFEMG